MKFSISSTLFLSLAVLLICFSCAGQTKALPPVLAAEPQSGTVAEPNLLPAEGVNQYANVRCGIQDKAGNLWFGTTGLGLYRYSPAGTLTKGSDGFTNFTEQDGLNSMNINCILEDKAGTLWIGTNAGLCRYYPLAAKIPGAKPISPIAIETVGGIVETSVWSIMQDKRGIVWFGTYDGVFCYDGISFTHFPENGGVINKSSIRLKAVTAILEDKSGTIWFATWFEGLCRYDGRSLTNLKPNKEVWFASLLEDKQGNIWAGSRTHGAYRYDVATLRNGSEAFTSFAQVKIFSEGSVFSMKEDKDGTIWFATEFDDLVNRELFGGVWSYHPPVSGSGTGSFTNFTTKDGLHHNSVFSVTIDTSGKIWFGTRDLGLNRYDPSASHNAGSRILDDFSRSIQRNDVILIPDGKGGFRPK